MNNQTPTPKDHPMMVAWEKYKSSEEYKNSFQWAEHEKHRDGSMWAAFVAGFEANTHSYSRLLQGGEMIET